MLNPSENATDSYQFSEQGIAWPGEAKKYTNSPDYNLDEIVPPPNWAAKFPNGYTTDSPPPDLRSNEHFQNWMRTAGLPTFTKLYGRNDGDKLLKGRYQLNVTMSTSTHRAVLSQLMLSSSFQTSQCGPTQERSR